MDEQRNNIQKMSRYLHKVKKNPKVQFDLEKQDFSEDLENLFKDPYSEDSIPIVGQERTFQKVTSDYIIDNIKENNIPYYVKTVKEQKQQQQNILRLFFLLL